MENDEDVSRALCLKISCWINYLLIKFLSCPHLCDSSRRTSSLLQFTILNKTIYNLHNTSAILESLLLVDSIYVNLFLFNWFLKHNSAQLVQVENLPDSFSKADKTCVNFITQTCILSAIKIFRFSLHFQILSINVTK